MIHSFLPSQFLCFLPCLSLVSPDSHWYPSQPAVQAHLYEPEVSCVQVEPCKHVAEAHVPITAKRSKQDQQGQQRRREERGIGKQEGDRERETEESEANAERQSFPSPSVLMFLTLIIECPSESVITLIASSSSELCLSLLFSLLVSPSHLDANLGHRVSQ